MIFVQACLFAVSSSTLVAIALAFAFGGLGPRVADLSLATGAAVAAWTFWSTRHRAVARWRRLNGWEWAAIAGFAIFSLRAFLWLVFWDGDKIEVLSPNNLGDLSLHLTYIRELANGAHFWPENPIYAGAKLTYPLGVDLFHSLLFLAGADLYRTFIWMGLAGCLCTGVALWRWGGAFTLVGFLCNGGLAGFLFFKTGMLADFQSELAWKSIPLALLVTQRGLLFALPAGLLLLSSWLPRISRAKGDASACRKACACRRGARFCSTPPCRFFTFTLSSFYPSCCWRGSSSLPRRAAASPPLWPRHSFPRRFSSCLITGNFHGPSVLGWSPGWMQTDPDFLKLCREQWGTSLWIVTFPVFWLLNFGLFPLFLGVLVLRLATNPLLQTERAAVFPALGIFLLCCFVKFAPWAWDNTKLMIWSYLTVLPFIWRHVLAGLPRPAIAGAILVLFWSGFISLLGGLDGSHRGYQIASRRELDETADALRTISPAARFIAQPDYNHPLVLLGRKLALGYTGHVWSHGYQWQKPLDQVDAILNGNAGWRSLSRDLDSRYLFWGPREREAYPDSKQSWRDSAKIIASGEWGEIFDLESPSTAESGFAGDVSAKSQILMTQAVVWKRHCESAFEYKRTTDAKSSQNPKFIPHSLTSARTIMPAATSVPATRAATSNCQRPPTVAILRA